MFQSSPFFSKVATRTRSTTRFPPGRYGVNGTWYVDYRFPFQEVRPEQDRLHDCGYCGLRMKARVHGKCPTTGRIICGSGGQQIPSDSVSFSCMVLQVSVFERSYGLDHVCCDRRAYVGELQHVLLTVILRMPHSVGSRGLLTEWV